MLLQSNAIVVYAEPAHGGSNWSTLLLPLVGVLVGSGLSLLAAWLKDRRDARTATQRWFEEEYVFAVDPVLHWFARWRAILRQQVAAIGSIPREEPFPFQQVSRLRSVLGSNAIEDLANAVDTCVRKIAISGEANERRMVLDDIDTLLAHLGELQREMLTISVSEKRNIYGLPAREPISALRRGLEETQSRLTALGSLDDIG